MHIGDPISVPAEIPAERTDGPLPDGIRLAWRVYTIDTGCVVGGYGLIWRTPVAEAQCSSCREVPGWDCACGIYGSYSFAPLPSSAGGRVVIALARPYGRVIPYRGGWRAQYAEVLAVYVLPGLELPRAWADCERLSARELLERVIETDERIIWQGARLPGADLSEFDLADAILYDADCDGANFVRTHMPRIDLRDARCRGALFSGADLSEANCRRINVAGAVLTRATLRGGDWRGAYCFSADFYLSDCRGVNFAGAELTRCDFGRADLRGADFRGALTEGVNFQGALTEGALFDEATAELVRT